MDLLASFPLSDMVQFRMFQAIQVRVSTQFDRRSARAVNNNNGVNTTVTFFSRFIVVWEKIALGEEEYSCFLLS